MQNTIGKLAVGHLQEVRSLKVLMLTISRLTGRRRGSCILSRTE